MSLVSLLRQVPLGTRVYSKIQSAKLAPINKRILDQILHTPYPQAHTIAQVVSSLNQKISPTDQYWKKSIEQQRNLMLRRTEPLVDGTLGEAGLYDQNVTIEKACKVSKPPLAALFLYLLIRGTKPQDVIELGTNVGISSAYIGAALKANNTNGHVTTLDASAYRQKLAQQIHTTMNIDTVSYVCGLFTDTLESTLKQMPTVDLAFIDGHHQYQPTLDYFEQILQYANPQTLFVFDDIRWSDGMTQAWDELMADERFGLVVDLDSVGLCMLQQPGQTQRYVFDPIKLF